MKTTADQILERQFSSDTGLEEPSDAIKSKVSRPSRMTKLAQARAKLCPVLAATPSVLPSACSCPVASRTRFHLQLGVAGSIQHTVGSELSTMDGSLLGASPCQLCNWSNPQRSAASALLCRRRRVVGAAAEDRGLVHANQYAPALG